MAERLRHDDDAAGARVPDMATYPFHQYPRTGAIRVVRIICLLIWAVLASYAFNVVWRNGSNLSSLDAASPATLLRDMIPTWLSTGATSSPWWYVASAVALLIFLGWGIWAVVDAIREVRTIHTRSSGRKTPLFADLYLAALLIVVTSAALDIGIHTATSAGLPGVVQNVEATPDVQLISHDLLFPAFLPLLLTVAVLSVLIGTLQRTHAYAPIAAGLRFLPDTWRDERNVDPLGHERLAQTLQTIIQRSVEQTPLTIAIEGKWGVGKTSILRRLKRRLTDEPFSIGGDRCTCFTIWFSATKYAGVKTQQALLSAVYDAIPRRALLWYYMSKGKLLSLLIDLIGSLTKHGELGAFISGRMNISGLIQDRYAEEFRELLTAWARSERAKRALFVVFVDDLDRVVSTSDIAQTLGLSKTFFDTEGCIFVFAFDQEVIAWSIEQTSPNLFPMGHANGTATNEQANGHDYLRKLIQVEVPVPGLHLDELYAYTRAAVRESGLEPYVRLIQEIMRENDAVEDPDDIEPYDVVEEITTSCGRNPRTIKRFLNDLIVRLLWTEHDGRLPSGGGATPEPEDYALAFVMLQQQYENLDAALDLQAHALRGDVDGYFAEQAEYV